MKIAVKAITDGKGELGVRIVLRLLREGEPVIMSKRATDFATLREVIDEVGRDAIRFMMLMRSSDAPLDASWTAAHLALLRAVENVIASGLRILGISRPARNALS